MRALYLILPILCILAIAYPDITLLALGIFVGVGLLHPGHRLSILQRLHRRPDHGTR